MAPNTKADTMTTEYLTGRDALLILPGPLYDYLAIRGTELSVIHCDRR